MALVQIPDHLRTSLWGWEWNRHYWPSKISKDSTDYKKKLHILEVAVLEDPRPENFYNRAEFYVLYGELQLALNDFYQCVQEDIENLKYLAERADLFLLLSKDDNALKDYLSLSNKIKEPKIYLKLCYLFLVQGNYFEAQFYYEQYLKSGIENSNSKTLQKYLEHVKRQSALAMKQINAACEENYTEENLVRRAIVKEEVVDLVGAIEDYMMLYLLFEKEEYQKAAYRLKMRVLEMRNRR